MLDTNFSFVIWDPILPDGYRLAGFTYDRMYRMLLEEIKQFSSPDKPDAILRTFATFADIENGHVLADEAAKWVPPGAYDIQGFAFVPDPIHTPKGVVPLPAGLPLYFGALMIGFGFAHRARMRQRLSEPT